MVGSVKFGKVFMEIVKRVVILFKFILSYDDIKDVDLVGMCI